MEFNELNYQRFESKLEQRMAEVKATIVSRFVALDARIDRIRDTLDARMVQSYGELVTRMDQGYVRLEARIDSRYSELRADMIKYLFAFWAGTIIPLVGIMVGLFKALN